MDKKWDNIELDEESREYLEFLKNNRINTSTTSYTVSALAKKFINGEIIVNHDYQRQEDQWSIDLERGLLLTWLEGYPTPPLMLARTTDENGKVFFELVDGQQRTGVARKWATNKIRLPEHLPQQIAGGRNRKYSYPDIASTIDETSIPIVIIDSCDKEQIKEIYGRLQRGVRLSLGQELRWQYGEIKQVLRKLSKHPLIKHMAKIGRDYGLAVAGYILVGVISKQKKKVPSYLKRDVLKTVKDYRNSPEIHKIFEECAIRANFMKEVFELTETTDIRAVDLVALNECLSKSEQWRTDEKIKQKWVKTWATYMPKLQKAEEMKKAKIDLAMSVEEWEKRGLIRYYDLVDKKNITVHSAVDTRVVVLQKEFGEE